MIKKRAYDQKQERAETHKREKGSKKKTIKKEKRPKKEHSGPK
jgi:hypothetical protein